MKVGSLFSGIGGIDLGLERAGMEIVWQVEVDPFCLRVLEKHWPTVKRYGDIRELTGQELTPVDLICGGFPCQPVSVAGKRKGTSDERWLWPEFARLLRVVRPRYVLIENVPGLLRLGGTEVLRDLAAIGYDAEWETIPAAALGAPHLRYRVFIVAFANSPRVGDSISKGVQTRNTTCSNLEQGSTAMADTQRERLAVREIFGCNAAKELSTFVRNSCTNWSTEPNLGRMAARLPARVDRLRALGNAVVPQVAEWIGRRIMEFEVSR